MSPAMRAERDASAGVPLTLYASKSAMWIRLNRSGRDDVIAWLIEDCSTSGATMRTSPKRAAAFASAGMPGL